MAFDALTRCPLLAIPGRQRVQPITTGLHPKADIKLPMYVYALITSVIGGKPVVDSDGSSRPEMTRSRSP